MRKVAVGISGGVDSAVAAMLVKRKGFDVIGVFMKNWDENDETGSCSVSKDRKDAQYVCDKLGIEFHEVNFVKQYWSKVFSYFLKEYQNGYTPNPDIMCNRFIKFDAFLHYCLKNLNVDAVATGHYANTSYGPYLENKNLDTHVKLLKAVDWFKDQTFFLSQVSQSSLQKVMFPIGQFLKEDVKDMAHNFNLKRVVLKRESTGICFIGKRNFQNFISEYVPPKPGYIVNLETGCVIQEHKGLHLWTIGQRVPVPGLPYKYFVARKCHSKNILYIVPGTDNPSLFTTFLYTSRPHWINSNPFSCSSILECQFRFQHTKPTIQCRVFSMDSSLLVQLEKPLKAITPGQFAVFYRGNECLGSSRISSPGPSLSSLNQLVPINYEEYHHTLPYNKLLKSD